MNKLLWALFFWVAPIFALFALYWKLVIGLFVLIMKGLVWIGQGALKLAGKAIQKAQEYRK
jgi:hypothetical protein